MRDKDLKYYSGLNYRIEIQEVDESEGGGYSAVMPQLGTDVFVSHGNTVGEAVASLHKLKIEIFKEWIVNGIPIPEPEDLTSFSGKVVLRMPPALHKKYVEYAKHSKVSLNTALVVALEKGILSASIMLELEERMMKCLEPMTSLMQSVLELQYHMAGKKEQIVELDAIVDLAS